MIARSREFSAPVDTPQHLGDLYPITRILVRVSLISIPQRLDSSLLARLGMPEDDLSWPRYQQLGCGSSQEHQAYGVQGTPATDRSLQRIQPRAIRQSQRWIDADQNFAGTDNAADPTSGPFGFAGGARDPRLMQEAHKLLFSSAPSRLSEMSQTPASAGVC
jgi:hypothetical protein